MSDVVGLYHQLGGDAAVSAIVEQLYQRLLGDARLAAYFAGAGVESLKLHQHAFLAALFNGPDRRVGPTLEEAHQGLHISVADFDQLVEHLVETLAELGAAEPLATEAVSRVRALREQVIQA